MAKEYWDTCLFIAFLKNSDDEQEDVNIIDALIRKAKKGDSTIIVSTFVIAEIRRRSIYDEGHWRIVKDIFFTNRPYVRLVSLNPRLADLASTIGAQHDMISPADAVHVATALSERVDVFYTLDGKREHGKRRNKDLLSFNGLIGNPPLRIEPPRMPLHTQLPFRAI